MDGRFEFRNCVRFAGPSMCGKTVTLCKLLANKKYFKPNAPKRVMWVSGSDTVDEKIEELIKSHYPDSQFFYGAPNCQKKLSKKNIITDNK